MKQLKITTKITTRDSYSVDRYLSEISKLPMVKEEQEIDLAKRIKSGEKKALDELIIANLRFVVSVAKQYQNQGLSLNDLINEGNIGLIKAATKFDETKGFKFISYAVWWIRQSILQALMEQPRIVRLPMNKATIYSQISKIASEFEQKNEREPSNEEVAELLGIKVTEIDMLKPCLSYHISTDQPVGEENIETFGDFLSDNSVPRPDTFLNEKAMQVQIDSALSILSPRELMIIKYYYGMNYCHQQYSLDEIGEKMSLTRERVRQLKDKSLRKIKKSTGTVLLKQYLCS
ncbi:MAG: RNA polymerase sigma factor RpoD/SigA [Chitinophagales bacterium]|nr:RNA polymerase sigma factor RpoD/SigA [Chitinophagales bacterium]MCZ2394669.1 RNA polymerase sigma factor RpoD/SigA [Chitinophagales bacterium]